jgi:hypothetical protein
LEEQERIHIQRKELRRTEAELQAQVSNLKDEGRWKVLLEALNLKVVAHDDRIDVEISVPSLQEEENVTMSPTSQYGRRNYTNALPLVLTVAPDLVIPRWGCTMVDSKELGGAAWRSSRNHPAEAFLEVLFRGAPHQHYLEIRPLGATRGDSSQGRRFIRIRQLQRRGFDQAVPVSLDGKANVFFGVLPRCRQSGKAVDVEVATCLWADLDQGWPGSWLEGLPQPSIVVESSPDRFQCYWLLAEPTTEILRVSAIVRRLSQALGGDNVADLPRILPIPGFKNLKYPERPVAHVKELHPERRFTLEQLDSALPALAQSGKGELPSRQPLNPGPFDTHAGGGDVPSAILAELQGELMRRAFRRHSDGRLVGACPFRHVNGPCDCDQSFFFSPISGRWWCFCTDHPNRDQDKSCVGGNVWGLWSVLFPTRSRTRAESSRLSPSSTLKLRGGDTSNSRTSIYDPPAPSVIEALSDAPKHRHTADLLRLVGLTDKALVEANCGTPLKGKCPNPKHGVVRELRASGKTHWCAGCNTETSSKYLHERFPDGLYSILRMQLHLEPQQYDAGEMEPGVWEINAQDGTRIADLITESYLAAVKQFKRVQRRYSHECLAWHFGVGHNHEGLWVEIQVLVRHSDQLTRVLQELTGGTRQAASFQPDAVIRSDYPLDQNEQLRRDRGGPAEMRIDQSG